MSSLTSQVTMRKRRGEKKNYQSCTKKLHFSTCGQRTDKMIKRWSWKKVLPWNVSIFVHWPCRLITVNFNQFFPFVHNKKRFLKNNNCWGEAILSSTTFCFFSYHLITFNNRKINGTTKMVHWCYLLVRSWKLQTHT